MSQRKHSWSERSELCRPPRGFHAPWMVSTAPNQTPAYYLPTVKRAPWASSDVVRDESAKGQIRMKRDCVVQRTILSTQHDRACTKFWTSLRGLFPCNRRQKSAKLDAFNPQYRGKTNTYRPRPVVNRVQVRNATIRCSSSVSINAGDLSRSLRSTDDAWHPPNWPGGIIPHAPLHPRPYDWSFPPPPPPPPSCHNIRLNPFLEHHCNGPHPISFDIALLGRSRIKVLHHTHASSTSTPLDPAHCSQPATYPPVRQMHIQAVAEDPLPHFPWPIAVTNTRGRGGITCGDVLDAISRKLVEHVSEGEYNSWTPYRRGIAARAYHQRVRKDTDAAVDDGRAGRADNDGNDNDGNDNDDDGGLGLRRIDYMGERVVFHGLERACATTTNDVWFVYLGGY